MLDGFVEIIWQKDRIVWIIILLAQLLSNASSSVVVGDKAATKFSRPSKDCLISGVRI